MSTQPNAQPNKDLWWLEKIIELPEPERIPALVAILVRLMYKVKSHEFDAAVVRGIAQVKTGHLYQPGDVF